MNSFDNTKFLQSLQNVAVKRWWIVPLCAALSTALIWAQTSGLKQEPTRVTVEYSYQARDSQPLLTSLGIDPGSMSPVPSGSAARAFIESSEFLSEVTSDADIHLVLRMTVNPVSPSGNSIGPAYDDESRQYLVCESISLNFCDHVAQKAAKRFESLRSKQISESLLEIASTLQTSLRSLEEISKGPLDDDQLKDVGLREIDLRMKIESLTELSTSHYFSVYPIGSRIVGQSETISTVSSRTYILGLVIGTGIGLLILFQMVLNLAINVPKTRGKKSDNQKN